MAATDPAFEAVVGKEALLSMAEKIREDSPRSASIHNSLLVHGKGYMDVYQFYVIKDKPETNAILLKDKTNQTTLALYCPETHEDSLLEALARTELISWDQMWCFHFVPETITEKLRKLMEGKIGGAKLSSSIGELYAYDQTKCPENLVCPAGFSVKRLSTEAVRQMHAIWKYRECSETNQFLELCKTAPCAGVYHSPDDDADRALHVVANGLAHAGDDEKAVAWASSTVYGPLGLLGVDESLKKNDDPKGRQLRKLLEQLVVEACASAMFRESYFVHCYLEHEETEIREMPGWKRVSASTWLWRCDGSSSAKGVQEENKGSVATEKETSSWRATCVDEKR